jgi:hypothetical protein
VWRCWPQPTETNGSRPLIVSLRAASGLIRSSSATSDNVRIASLIYVPDNRRLLRRMGSFLPKRLWLYVISQRLFLVSSGELLNFAFGHWPACTYSQVTQFIDVLNRDFYAFRWEQCECCIKFSIT